MLKILSRGVLFVVPFWILGSLIVGAYHFVAKVTRPLLELFVSEETIEKHSVLFSAIEVTVVIALVFFIGLFLSSDLIKRFSRSALGKIPVVGQILLSYFKVEDRLTGSDEDNSVVIIRDEDDFHYIGIHTGSAEGKAIVYCPSFPAITGTIILVPEDKLIPTTMTFAEAMKIFSTLGLTHIKN